MYTYLAHPRKGKVKIFGKITRLRKLEFEPIRAAWWRQFNWKHEKLSTVQSGGKSENAFAPFLGNGYQLEGKTVDDFCGLPNRYDLDASNDSW